MQARGWQPPARRSCQRCGLWTASADTTDLLSPPSGLGVGSSLSSHTASYSGALAEGSPARASSAQLAPGGAWRPCLSGVLGRQLLSSQTMVRHLQ
eukprot:3827393-Pyramimonas_sp.AAC.1